jgi:hypothetical protein
MPTEISFGEYQSSEGSLVDEVFESPQEALDRTGLAEDLKARLQSFMEDDDLQDQELDTELQPKMDSLMEPRPLRPKGVALEEPDWPSFEQLPSTATFEGSSLTEDITDEEKIRKNVGMNG